MKNKNPFDELIELWIKDEPTFYSRFSNQLSLWQWFLTNMQCPDHLLNWWDKLGFKERYEFYYMRLLFAREMWEDGQR